MAAINFPSNPQPDDVWTQNGRSWIFDGTSWNAFGEEVKSVEYTTETGSAILPKGTTAQRDVPPSAGYLRYNTETNEFEGYSTTWGSVGNPTIINDLITNTNYYVTLSGVTAGTTASLRVSSSKLSFNPSTGTLSATTFSGSGADLTGVALTTGTYTDPAWIASLSATKLSGTVSGDRGVTAGSSSSSFVEYNGVTKTAGQFYGGTSSPDSTTRLNYDGHFYATKLYGDGSAITGINVDAGATGGSTDKIFWVNDTIVTANYTVPTGKNAGTFGPITINNDVVVTVPDGSTWTVV